MGEIGRKVKLLKPFDVDLVTIRKDRYFTNAYVIDLPLDSIPDHVWQDIFERTWKSSRHLWDRKLFVIGDKLRIVTTADEFEHKLDWIEQIIGETNKGVEEYNLAAQKKDEIRIREEIRRQRVWDEKARVEMIKETLRKKFSSV